MKFYIINLKHDIDRRNHMLSIFNNLSIVPEISNAVYGKELPDIEYYINYNKQISIKEIKRTLSPGEIGCIMSHQNIYRRIIEKNIPYAIILEDDIDIDKDLKLINIDLLNKLNFDILLLGYHGELSRDNLNLKKREICNVNSKYMIYELLEIAYGTYGYIISLNGAKRILNQSLNFDLPIDHYTGNNKINTILCIYPQLININKKLSDNSILEEERQLYHIKIKFENEFLFLSNEIRNLDSPIIIYGFNDLGLLIYKNFTNKVTTIIDKNKTDLKIDNITIQSIDTLNDHNNRVFIITAVNKRFIQEIKEEINSKFKKSKIITLKEFNK